MRIMLLLLSLAVCFLIGVLYGMDREKDDVAQDSTLEHEIVESIEDKLVVEEPEENVEQVHVIQSGDNTPAYKAASALSSVVEFIYEIIVEILFQISKLFY